MTMKYQWIALSIGLILLAFNLQAGCWDLEARSEEGFSELDEVALLSFKDAVDCSPLDGAKVSIGGKQLNTEADGSLRLPLDDFDTFDDIKIPFTVTKQGYIPFRGELEIMAGSVWNMRFLLSRGMPIDHVRFVLRWGNRPRDLDLHLTSPDFHISYRNMKSVAAKVDLDRDATNGFGPETITLKQVDPDKTYCLFVHRYSSEGEITGQAKVDFYQNNELAETITLPKTSRRYVEVLQISSNQVTVFNQPKDRISE
jgi:hypothetical protein